MDDKGAKSEVGTAVLGALGKGLEASVGLSSIGAGAIDAGGPGSAIKLESGPATDSSLSGEEAGLEGSLDIGAGGITGPSSCAVESRSLVLTLTISAGRVGLAIGLMVWGAAGSGWVAAREGTGRRGTLGQAASAKGRSRLRNDSPSPDSNRFSLGFDGGDGAAVGEAGGAVGFIIDSGFTWPPASAEFAGGSV